MLFVQPCWPLKQMLLDLDNNNLMALTLIVFVAVMFFKVFTSSTLSVQIPVSVHICEQ